MLADMMRLEAARKERESTMRIDVDGLLHSVNGNAAPGIKTDVQMLKKDMVRVYWLGSVIVIALIGDIVATLWK